MISMSSLNKAWAAANVDANAKDKNIGKALEELLDSMNKNQDG